jgi:2-oxoglutarate ferredoxin oxidoreductase subunit beta
MMRRLKEQSVTLRQAQKMSEEDKTAKIVRGVFVDRDIPEYTQLYDQIIERAQEGTRSSKASSDERKKEVA